MAEAGEIVQSVRIHQRFDIRQFLAGLMMVDHHHRQSEAFRLGQRLQAGGAAIDGHQQRGTLAGQHPDGLGIGAIAFENPVGNVDQRIESAMAQMPCQQRRRGRAVNVVIAENRDLFVSHRRVRDAFRRGFHLRHGKGIGHQFADRRIEKILDRIDLDVASGQHPRQHFRQLIALCNRQRPRRPALIEPIAPCLAGYRMRHAEKGRWHCDREC
jgi:hypothetical protein